MRRLLILIKGTWANWTDENVIAESLISSGWRVIAVTPIGSVFPDYYIIVEVYDSFSNDQILQQLRSDLSWYVFKSAEIVTVDLPQNYNPNAPIVFTTPADPNSGDPSGFHLPDGLPSVGLGAGAAVLVLFLVLFLTKK